MKPATPTMHTTFGSSAAMMSHGYAGELAVG